MYSSTSGGAGTRSRASPMIRGSLERLNAPGSGRRLYGRTSSETTLRSGSWKPVPGSIGGSTDERLVGLLGVSCRGLHRDRDWRGCDVVQGVGGELPDVSLHRGGAEDLRVQRRAVQGIPKR